MAEDTRGMGIPLPADSTPIHQYPKVAREMGEKIAEILTGNITPALQQQISLRVAEAVAPALADEIQSAGLLSGASRTADPDLVFAIADLAGRASWLAIGADGAPPAHTVQILAAALREALTGSAQLTGNLPELQDVAFSVTDAAGRRSELEIGTDGRLTQRVIDSIADRLPPTQTKYATKLACWGDSLTYSQSEDGQPDPSWPELAGQILGVPVFNGGKPAHGSADIATRQGGLRPLVTLENGTIPASGKVALTSIMPADGWRASGSYTLEIAQGTLAGIPGKLTHDLATSTRYFTRTTAGDPVSVPAGTPFIGSDGVGWRDAAVVIWAGTNNPSQTSAIMRDIDSMIAWIAPYTDKYIVLPLTAGTGPNAALQARYGEHYEDHRTHLIRNGLREAGITPTAADTAAIAQGKMPPSLLYDGTHFTQAGYDIIGRYVARRLKERGFFA